MKRNAIQGRVNLLIETMRDYHEVMIDVDGNHISILDHINQMVDVTGQVKQTWWETMQAQVEGVNRMMRARDQLMQQEQRAFDMVVGFIEERRQRELQAINDIHQREMRYWNDRRRIVEEHYRRQIRLVNDLHVAENWQRDLNRETDELARIQAEIDMFALIDTQAARTRVSELTRQLNQQQDRINDMQRERNHQQTVEALERDMEQITDHIDERIEAEQEAHQEALALLDERYDREKVHQEAMRALRTGYLRMFYQDSVNTYRDIERGHGRAYRDMRYVMREFNGEAVTLSQRLTRYNDEHLFKSYNNITSAIEDMNDAIQQSINLAREFELANTFIGQMGSDATQNLAGSNPTITGDDRTQSNNNVTPMEQTFLNSGRATPRELDIINEMQWNSSNWRRYNATGNQEGMDYAHDANLRLGPSIGATFDAGSGRWFKGGMPLYHNERIPDWVQSDPKMRRLLDPDEHLAIIQKREAVLQPETLKPLLEKVDMSQGLFAKLANFNPFTNINPLEQIRPTVPSFGDIGGSRTSTIGDIIINIAGNADERTMQRASDNILERIQRELERTK